MKKTKLFGLFSIALALSATSGLAQAVQNSCSKKPFNPASGNYSQLVEALQRATNTGVPVTITGDFTISKPITIVVRKDLTVNASGATFTSATGLDGDMFSIDAVKSASDQCRYSNKRNANVSWKGGYFEFSKSDNSAVVPIQSLVPPSRQGVQKTGDALSIRGAWTNGPQRIDNALVDGVLMRGTLGSDKVFSDAGGDSGVFISSVKRGEVRNSEFYGIRDAGIYVSANGQNANMRSEYHLINNVIKRAFDGISSKRGADGIVMRGNEIVDTAVGLSIKQNLPGRVASNITIENNEINRSVRAILLENTRNSKVNNNAIVNLGGKVAGSESALGGGGKYRGVTFENLDGTLNQMKNNNFSADGSTSQRRNKTVIALSKHGNAPISITGNTYNSYIDIRSVNE
ncbi:right-handed parallel beta-helix repeat-containing protein [Pseudoalteromonas sp. Angola-30]|uniref:right-handed parallel beta-helix repeat-containing protein n=1 Tax=Pseudoalteromonas sp. Angola-30 TaxID=3025341 RepID=UPI00235A17E9|nr:right-handed parallel beta-helix repeat-containing protein [Pseudoalteromonas sp. Angola-30]MDC9526806.1 right-handed parallel beta-helix repeat-containing protein [Pseudoalteromonas sp. Angola-30]